MKIRNIFCFKTDFYLHYQYSQKHLREMIHIRDFETFNCNYDALFIRQCNINVPEQGDVNFKVAFLVARLRA